MTSIIQGTILNQSQSAFRANVGSLSQPGMSAGFGEPGGSGELSPAAVRGGLSRAEGPLHSERGLLHSLHQGLSNQSLGASVFGSGQEFPADVSVPVELTAADMSLSTLYLHELHHRQVSSGEMVLGSLPGWFLICGLFQIRRRGYQEMATRSIWQRSPVQELATLPEVRQERAPLLRHGDSSVRNPGRDS